MKKSRETENFIRGMYPWDILHKFGLNGKVSGTVSAAGEMENAVMILHGPRGCGFSYHISAHRRYPYYDLICTDMDREDVIMGGAEKLSQTIRKYWEEKHPELIILVHTPVSDVLHEDMAGIAREFREKGIPVINVESTNFSHRNKDFCSDRLKRVVDVPGTDRSGIGINLKGCGVTELLKALVDEVMEPCEVRPKTVNIEMILMKGEVYRELFEMTGFLVRFGISVNAFLPGSPVELIRQAPAAALNLTSRLEWAEYMKDVFGTPFVHYRSFQRYYGWEGLKLFYRDIFARLQMGEEAHQLLLSYEKDYYEKALPCRKELKDRRVNLLVRSAIFAPREILFYAQTIGVTLNKVYFLLTPEDRIEQEIPDGMEKQLFSRAEEAARAAGAALLICESQEEIRNDPDFPDAEALLNTDDFSMEELGLPVIGSVVQEMVISYDSYVRVLRKMTELLRNARKHPELLLKQLYKEPVQYPAVQTSQNRLSQKIWNEMWLR